MRILLYEFISSGGWYGVGQRALPPVSLRREGMAMLKAVAADFAALEDVRVVVLRDQRWTELAFPDCQTIAVASACDERAKLETWSKWADWTLIIAPEFDGLLLHRCRWAMDAGGRMLGPGLELIALTSDKQATAEWLHAAGVNVPKGVAVPAGGPLPGDFDYPAVWKPRDGAGSQGIRWLDPRNSPTDATFVPDRPGRIERFCPGAPVSVAWICGPAGRFALPACRQRISEDGTFAYLGGSTPLPQDIAKRAMRCTERGVAALPAPRGYLGIDAVLGEDADGSQDVIIEVNPRLTTSYVGLRAIASDNLALAMLNVALGITPCLSFRSQVADFGADGTTCVRQTGL